MGKFYEEFKTLIIATTISGLYFPSIEKIYGSKWYIKLLKLFFIFPAVSLPIYLIASLKYTIFDDASLVSKLYGFVTCVYSFFSTFVIYAFYYSQKDIVKVFELWDTLFQDELFPEHRQEILRKNKRFANGWLKIFGSLNVLSALIYSLVTYWNTDKKLDHPFGIPYRHQTPDFELVATLELLVATFGFAMLVSYDCITMVLLSLEDAQFKHLKYSLDRIVGILVITDSGNITLDNCEQITDILETLSTHSLTIENKVNMEEVFLEVEKKLKIWILHHLQLLRFHKELQKIYNVPFSVKFLVFIMIICLVSFLSVSEGGFTIKDFIMSVLFCCNNYLLFYVNARLADGIKETGENFFEEAFGRSWNFYPKKIKTGLKIILLRKNLPVHFSAFKIYPLSSKSFLKILTSAYSFCTFLLHVNNKKN